MGLREARLIDVPIIIDLLSTYYDNLDGVEYYLSKKLRDRLENSYILNEDNTILFIFERMGYAKCQVHCYAKEGNRGKKVLEFFKQEVLPYIKETYKYTCFLSFVPKDSPHIEWILKKGGFIKVSDGLKDAGGIGNPEKLYILEVN